MSENACVSIHSHYQNSTLRQSNNMFNQKSFHSYKVLQSGTHVAPVQPLDEEGDNDSRASCNQDNVLQKEDHGVHMFLDSIKAIQCGDTHLESFLGCNEATLENLDSRAMPISSTGIVVSISIQEESNKSMLTSRASAKNKFNPFGECKSQSLLH